MNSIMECSWDIGSVINYAMQQNHVPIVKQITLRNISATRMESLRVEIHSEPSFIFNWSKQIDGLDPDQMIALGVVPLQIKSSFLGELTERISGHLLLKVYQGEDLIYEENSPIELLAYDEWGGLAVLPELIGAFVTPNHPALQSIISSASNILRIWGESPSLDSYQSQNPNRVRLQVAALYTALQQHNITYCVEPASYERIGQRVRLADSVLQHKMGNCLDITLLFAACIEAIGLHPLIVFTRGHAFLAVWLVNDTFPETIQDDISVLTKRSVNGIDEITLIECTALVTGEINDFEQAERHGKKHLEHIDNFECVIDIARARISSIRPIPMRVMTSEGVQFVEEQPDRKLELGNVPLQLLNQVHLVEGVAVPVTKQSEWERRLLDMTLRNSLLNFRLSKSSIPIMTTVLDNLEDALADNEEFQLLGQPEEWAREVRSTELFISSGLEHPLSHLLQQEFEKKRLRANLATAELEQRIIHLYRTSRLAIEENGANTLYLALGLLKWYETDASELPRYAPIVMIPIEISRKSSRQGYVIKMRDEDPQMNITLLEMLRQDYDISISGLDPLPKDERGVDLKIVFSVIRRAIMQLARWDIEETACLGLFSFGQFVMWNDIRNRSTELANNAIVASLIQGSLQWVDEVQEHTPLDEVAPSEFLLPISADSSQLEAVRDANNGRSFVLHGPPGTGKSQTITNMIASAIASGKQVLFVAEKMAALNVVQKRLADIGLAPFCLELHSNKSSKKTVLNQLNAALEATKIRSPEEWTLYGERIRTLKQELNEHVHALHKKQHYGFSLYDAIARYDKKAEQQNTIVFPAESIAQLTEAQVASWRDLIGELKAVVQSIETPHEHVWRHSNVVQFTPNSRVEIEGILSKYREVIAQLQHKFADINALWPELWEGTSRKYSKAFASLCELLGKIPDITLSLLQLKQTDTAIAELQQLVTQGQKVDRARSELLNQFRPEIMQLNIRELHDTWVQLELKWFLPKLLGQNKLVKLLRSYVQAGKTVTKQTVFIVLQSLLNLQEEEARLKRHIEKCQSYLGSTLLSHDGGNWQGIEAACEWVVSFERELLASYATAAQGVSTKNELAQRLGGGLVQFNSAYGALLGSIVAAYQSYEEVEKQIAITLAIDWTSIELEDRQQCALTAMLNRVVTWQNHISDLRDWSIYRSIRALALEQMLMPVIVALEAGRVQHYELIHEFEQALHQSCANYTISDQVIFAQFSGMRFEEKIKRFKELDQQYEEYTRLEIYAKLAMQVPTITTEIINGSEVGILQRAIRSGGRGVSIRKLFDSIPTLLSRLAPCLLMSPISVAQYIDPERNAFDIVIFDEASQVPTSQAVGALARGKQAIIVGDPKQLPPTSFFTKGSRSSMDDDGGIFTEDLESILEDCLALGMPERHLAWHYRSRHESLIAFSNIHYYGSNLLTFPSPEAPLSNVKFVAVDGYYDRGRTKKNIAEAEAIVAEISRRLLDEQLRRFSIGVVSFSSIQQGVIEDLLDEAYQKNPLLEQYHLEMPEPIFVKNLENVQGDERDIILFSVGYGPDRDGKISYNFGPLNRDGGWRRLNVAVSRSRHEMIVFSTLHAHHLSSNRTSSPGVLDLKAFLEYAEKGSYVLPSLEIAKHEVSSSQLHRNIADALNKRGYQVDINVGSSAYRVDLAVRDKDREESYLLGIVLDGIFYERSNTVRDRDVLRNSVLRNLGWSLHQVWVLDWWNNSSAEIDKMVTAIELAQARQVDGIEEVAVTSRKLDNKIIAQYEEEVILPSQGQLQYVAHILATVPADMEYFHSPQATLMIDKQLRDVIEYEGPISATLLQRRVLQAWGGRMGARVERRFKELLYPYGEQLVVWDQQNYYWPTSNKAANYGEYRVNGLEINRRSAEDIPPEELCNVLKAIIIAQISMPQEELMRQSSKLLGFSKVVPAFELQYRQALQYGLANHIFVADENGRVKSN